jgi:iron complex transport system substrate-binding protein
LVLELAGVENAAAALEPGDFGQVPMSKEVVVELNPDFLFVPGFIWGDPGAAEDFLRSVLEDPAFEGLTAIENEQVIAFPERLKGTYSHYLMDAAEAVAETVYPEYFAD